MITTLKVPKTGGIRTTKANVVRWLKREGDAIKVGEPVVELETEMIGWPSCSTNRYIRLGCARS